MSGASVTRAKLSKLINEKVGLPYQQSSRIVDQVLEEMIQAIIRDKTLKIASFGTFAVRHKKERIGRNPRTKAEAVIDSRNVLSFKASNILKQKVDPQKTKA